MTASPIVESTGSIIRTEHLGEISWNAGAELFLPVGLPGFEDLRLLIPVEIPAQRPLVFLQSPTRPELCFVSLPAKAICPEYQLELTEEDRALLGLDRDRTAEIGQDLLCLAILLPSGGSVEANLGAPLVINLHNSRCVQCFVAPLSIRYRLSAAAIWERLC